MDFLGSDACAKVGDFFASKCIDFRWQALSPAAAEMDCDEIGYDTNVYGFKKKIISQHHMTKVVLVSACVKKNMYPHLPMVYCNFAPQEHMTSYWRPRVRPITLKPRKRHIASVDYRVAEVRGFLMLWFRCGV